MMKECNMVNFLSAEFKYKYEMSNIYHSEAQKLFKCTLNLVLISRNSIKWMNILNSLIFNFFIILQTLLTVTNGTMTKYSEMWPYTILMDSVQDPNNVIVLVMK